MIVIVTGKTCSGKDTFVKNELSDYQKIVAYTTRPMRDNEVNHIDYHFVSDSSVTKNKKGYKRYINGWEYWFDSDDIQKAYRSDKNYVLITDCDGCKEITSEIPATVYYLKCDLFTRMKRYYNRQPCEQLRRLIADEEENDEENYIGINIIEINSNNSNETCKGDERIR